MSRCLPVLCVGLLWAGSVQASGFLIPTDSATPPLAMVSHHVEVSLVEQVSTTKVTQVFRNHTDRALEATYIFPVPKGASVNRFAMWLDGKEVKGELVEADKARQVYTDIVRRLQDPGLLEYVGSNLLKLRVYPVPAHGDQKLTLTFTAVGACENGLCEYVYPLKTEGKAAEVLESFSLHATLKSEQKVHNVYSPTHAVKVTPHGDHETHIAFECERCTLDKDLQLYYSLGGKDIGLTMLTYRPDKHKDGYFMLLVSPRAELSKSQQVPRDMVFVLDTSSSMAGPKMEQAKKALKFCLDSLKPHDRFAVLNFATTVNRFTDGLTAVTPEDVKKARQWVDELDANGGTAINDALAAALDTRPAGSDRNFTVVFFTDGQPTIGESDPAKILANVTHRNNTNTRIFTFGVGDDVNAALLDQLADQTRSVSTYVRPQEDIEVKVGGLYSKISHPVLTDLKLVCTKEVKLSEMYPTKFPDLFHAGQLIVLGRYHGHGHAALALTGKADKEGREFIYKVEFPEKTSEDKAFVEGLWARRKVGYLLDEIRSHGEKKELVDEVVRLAKKHGIATPYTSYLLVPDTVAPVAPVVNAPLPVPAGAGILNGYTLGAGYQSFQGMATGNAPIASSVPQSAPRINYAPAMTAPAPGSPAPVSAAAPPPPAPPGNPLRIFERGGKSRAEIGIPESEESPGRPLLSRLSVRGLGTQNRTDPVFVSLPKTRLFDPTTTAPLPQAGKEGVDFAVQLDALRNENRLAKATSRRAAGRTCLQVGGGWVDDDYKAGMTTVTVKALSEAYFRMLERHPELKEVFQLGRLLVWITPNGTALVVNPAQGEEKMSDERIDALFATK
ncbi:MAG: VWA domain-containing protein [Planctomycetes bacterium]|nr:VWA domain-containing protein [Planctomycetota bacterium]